MKKEVYDGMGKMSVFLKLKIEELEMLSKERDEILREIEELKEKNELEQNFPKIKVRMDKNLAAIEKVTKDIKKLREVDLKGR